MNFDVFPYEVQVSTRSSFMEMELASRASEELSASLSILLIVYIAGSIVVSLVFAKQIITFYHLCRKAKFTKMDGFCVSVGQTSMSFSFLNKIFIESKNEVLLAHEKAHCQQLHSVDRVFLALLQVIFWFNPLIILYRRWLIENHEFTADQMAIKDLKLKRSEYAQYLLDYKVSSSNKVLLINRFSSQLKSRIIMLNLNQKLNPVSHILLSILLVGLFSSFALNSYPVYNSQDSPLYLDTIPANSKILDTTIVFDPTTQQEYVKVEVAAANEEVLDTLVVFDPATGKERLVLRPVVGKGKTGIVRIDTSVIFDPKTFKESFIVNKVTLPEGVNLDGNVDLEIKNEMFDKYGERTTVEIETYAGKAGYFINFTSGHQGFNLTFNDSSGKQVFTTRVKAGDEEFELIKANLSPGSYTAIRSDTREVVEIRIL
jgi:hypothetical protein